MHAKDVRNFSGVRRSSGSSYAPRLAHETRARGCRPCAGSPFLNGLSNILGRNKNEEKSNERSNERSTIDKMLSGEAGKPVFPPYTVIAKTKEYSLRLYSVFPVVEMEYQRREEGYAALGGYIDGRNAQTACFAFSQPVVMCYYPDGRKVMQMYLGARRGGPSDGAVEGAAASTDAASVVTSLPAPTEAAMRVGISGGELVAVMQFDGYITPANAEAVRQRLIACLQRDGIRLCQDDAAGRFRCAQYGAVYQLGERLNEMMLQVEV